MRKEEDTGKAGEKGGRMTKGSDRKTRCLFCRNCSDLTFHHNYNYLAVKAVLEKIFGKPSTEDEHLLRQKEIIRINESGGVVPLCRRCHRAWEIGFVNKVVMNNENGYEKNDEEEEAVLDVYQRHRSKRILVERVWKGVIDATFISLGWLFIVFNGFPSIVNLDSLNQQPLIIFCLGFVFFSRLIERMGQLWNWAEKRFKEKQEDDKDG